jgi:DNA-binding NarL/FixJ family response regulator
VTRAQPVPPVRAYIVANETDARSDLRSLVTSTPGFVLAGEASSAQAAIAPVFDLRPDLVLIGVQGVRGLTAAEVLADSRRDLVVALTVVAPLEQYVAFTSAGAEIAVLSRSELSTRSLLDLWHGRKTR